MLNLFAHSSCTSLFILIFIKSTGDCIAHLLLILFFIVFLFFLTFSILLLPICIYSIFSCVMFHFLFYFILFFLHCPLSGPVLTYISLLIIPCMIVYVTNNKEPWTFFPLFWKKYLMKSQKSQNWQVHEKQCFCLQCLALNINVFLFFI